MHAALPQRASHTHPRLHAAHAGMSGWTRPSRRRSGRARRTRSCCTWPSSCRRSGARSRPSWAARRRSAWTGAGAAPRCAALRCLGRVAAACTCVQQRCTRGGGAGAPVLARHAGLPGARLARRRARAQQAPAACMPRASQV
jgi:hypothetical protein